MKILKVFVFSSLFLLNLSYAADNVTQSVSISYGVINDITVSGNPPAMVVTGSPDTAYTASDNSTTYSIFSNEDTTSGLKKIIGEIGDAAMPANTNLAVTLATTVGSSEGSVELSFGSQDDLVTSIPELSGDQAQTITILFTADLGSVGSGSSIERDIKFTFTDQ